VLIIGCGRIGQRVAAHYIEQGRSVSGLVSRPENAQALQTQGIEALEIDLDSAPLSDLSTANSDLFYFAPPPSSGQTDPRMRHVIDAMQRSAPPRRLVYISTSGVYGDCQGEWIDETRATNPQADRARRRLDAENQLRAWSERTGAELVILRVAGIYGPSRLPIERIKKRLPIVRKEEAPFTNRIHEDDLVNICIQSMEKPVAGEIFNVSDGHPGAMAEYFDAVADFAGLERPPKISLSEAQSQLSPEMWSYLMESRRMSNAKQSAYLSGSLLFPGLMLAN
jgi:nucleoside-diphosphate-sugar epimerase